MRKTYRFTRVLFLSMLIESIIYILVGSVGKYSSYFRIYGLWSIHIGHHYDKCGCHNQFYWTRNICGFSFTLSLVRLFTHGHGAASRCGCLQNIG